MCVHDSTRVDDGRNKFEVPISFLALKMKARTLLILVVVRGEKCLQYDPMVDLSCCTKGREAAGKIGRTILMLWEKKTVLII